MEHKLFTYTENWEFCLGCVHVFNFIYLFVPVLFTNLSWEWGWQNSGWGSCQSESDINWRLIPLPLPLLYLSPPSSCLIMLPCVCLSVCICVWRGVCSCAHRANVCSSNTGFSPSLSPTSLPPLSPPLMVTRSRPLNFKPNRIYLSILFVLLHTFTLHLSCFSLPTTSIHLSIHWSIYSLTLFGFHLPTS